MTDNFEHILLKKLIYNSQFFSKTNAIIKKNYFKSIGCTEVFSLLKDYYGEYHSLPTPTELIVQVKNVPNAELRKEIITELQNISKTEEVANLDFMLEETVSWVKDAIYLEALRVGSDAIMKKDEKLKLKAKQLMEEMGKISIDSDLGLDFDDISVMIQYYQEKLLGILTQHKEFNKRLGTGFLPGTLSVILAASGIGKSLLKTDIISGMIKQGKKILLISMEMSDKEMMKRVHANALDLPINYLTDLNKTENQLNALKAERPDMRTISKDEILKKYNDLKMSGTLGKLYIKDYPNGTFTASMLDGLLETYKNELDLDFDIVFLDYLGIMKSDLISPNAGLYSYVKSIVEEVRAIAKKHQIPIISSSQLNRSAVNNTDASNDSVSDSIGTVQTADFMVFLLQTEQMKTENRILCKVTKNRFNGRTDTWEMQVDYQHMRFSDCVDTMSNAQIAEAVGLIGDDMKANIEIIKKENSKNNIEESWDTNTSKTAESDEDIMKLLGI